LLETSYPSTFSDADSMILFESQTFWARIDDWNRILTYKATPDHSFIHSFICNRLQLNKIVFHRIISKVLSLKFPKKK